MILNQDSMNVNLAAPGLFYVHMLLSHMLHNVHMDVEKKFCFFSFTYTNVASIKDFTRQLREGTYRDPVAIQ